MSITLDADPIVIDVLDFAPECYWETCTEDSSWVGLWRCGCPHTYCQEHRAIIARETYVLCDDVHSAFDNIAPATWSRL